jgi:uncharacterized protein YaiI (UPF0178 family)
MADHTAIVTEVRGRMDDGDKAAALRLVRRYTDGADSALAEDLIDRAQAVLDRETEAHAARVSEARRELAAREIADKPRATTTRREAPRPSRSSQDARAEKKVSEYFVQRDTTIPDTDRGTDAVYASGFDYEEFAVARLRGEPCVDCGCELRRSEVVRGRWHDGLCSQCRDDGRPGIPAPPAGHTRAQAIGAWCAWFARSDRSGQGGLPRIRGLYRRTKNDADRQVIAAWVKTRQNPTS